MPNHGRRFEGGWAPFGAWKRKSEEVLEKIRLPDTVICALCERDLPLTHFTPSALKRLRSAVLHQGIGILANQQIARCDGCGTQSRPELHCMSCNKVRLINEFAHAQRQFAQPVCLPCQDNLQLDERDKLPDDQVLPVDLTQTELPEPGIEEEPSEWTLDIPMEIDMSQHNVGREDDLDEDDSSQDEERVALSSLMRSTPSDSRPVTLGPTQNQTIIQDMDLETLFE